MKFAVLVAGQVDLISSSKPSDDAVEVPDHVSIGWRLVDGGWIEPDPVEPTLNPLTRFQFEVVLDQLNITQQQIFDAIDADAGMTAEAKLIAKAKVRTGGNDGKWSRGNPLWERLGSGLGVTSEQIDTEWLKAQALT